MAPQPLPDVPYRPRIALGDLSEPVPDLVDVEVLDVHVGPPLASPIATDPRPAAASRLGIPRVTAYVSMQQRRT